METKIVTLDGGDISGAIFIEASPTPGAAGIIACNYLVESLGGKPVLEIFSPHFPQVSIINEKGIASRPKVELHLVRSDKVKLLIMTRTFPVESNEGSHEIARAVFEYLLSKDVAEYMVLASGRVTGDRSVFVTSTDPTNSGLLIAAGAKPSPSLDSLPVDRLTGFLMTFFARAGRKISLVVSDTSSYLPDPIAARKLLEVVTKAINLELDFTKLDTEIERQKQMFQEAEQLGYGAGRDGRDEKYQKEPFYIG
ncbi:MAG: PAC2 family protein [Nitrososphaerota archaeon]